MYVIASDYETFCHVWFRVQYPSRLVSCCTIKIKRKRVVFSFFWVRGERMPLYYPHRQEHHSYGYFYVQCRTKASPTAMSHCSYLASDGPLLCLYNFCNHTTPSATCYCRFLALDTQLFYSNKRPPIICTTHNVDWATSSKTELKYQVPVFYV